MTKEEAHDRITFLSAGLALTTERMVEQWPSWHAEENKIEKEYGRDSPKHLGWRCRFAHPAYIALGFITN